MSCLFCKIVRKEIPAKIAHEDDDTLAFHDINPVAPTHVLVIPKRHIVSLADATPEDEALLGKLLLTAKRIADAEGRTGEGFRTVINSGPNAGQSVFHVHVHVIGGRPMAWPPG
ncbi:MAG: histidine triad nucleotide-binding protein [Polyangiaceae bacterium]